MAIKIAYRFYFHFMFVASSDDKELIVDILSQSIGEEKCINYNIPQDKKRAERIRYLIDYSFEVSRQFGEVYISDDRKACAIVLYPQQKKGMFSTFWLDVKLVIRTLGISGTLKSLKSGARAQKDWPADNIAYLWYIGVYPKDQQQGVGSKLLKQIITEADKDNYVVCLETSTRKNLSWYERFGFQIYHQIELEFSLFFLKRIFSAS